MSKSDWVKPAISVTKLAIFAAVLIAAVLISLTYFLEYQENQSKDTDTASRHNLEASQQGPESCRPIVDEGGVFDWLTCIAKTVSAESGIDQAKNDLQAQQDMAAWALGMLIVTVWMAVITFVGVIFVWRTLTATQEMSREATRIGEAQTVGHIVLGFEMCEIVHLDGPSHMNSAFNYNIGNVGVTALTFVSTTETVKVILDGSTIYDEIADIIEPKKAVDIMGGGSQSFRFNLPRLSGSAFAENSDLTCQIDVTIRFQDIFRRDMVATTTAVSSYVSIIPTEGVNSACFSEFKTISFAQKQRTHD